ncbi:hypothetical protein [Sciscionella sediminilitoris]|uniref:hypothetical protein n=1 Tax=Sciscionella sediminilitoris TaxID=1445613 RepID=UPI0004DECDC8|nr:hypothetical protein [Sciscionella sp. SE31]
MHPLVHLGRLTFETDDEALEREIRAVLAPEATLRLNGRETDLAGYLMHVRELRSGIRDGTLTVIDEIRAEDALAARVAVRMQLTDGSAVHGESHLIGRIGADGRLTRMTEIGRLIGETDDPA